MLYARRAAIVLVLAAALGALLWSLQDSSATAQLPPTPTVSDAEVQKFVRSVSVQVLVRLEKYTRSLTWYQEVDAKGQRGEWKVRFGEWSKQPEQITVSGSGVIVYSNSDGFLTGTFIVSNAHVVSYLVTKESLGSATKPIDVYHLEDLVIRDMPPSIEPKEGARPYQQMYFKLPSNYAEIRYSEDQFFTIYARVVDYDLALDIALLQICTPSGEPARVWGLPYATLRDVPPQVGEEVWICGAPLGIPFSIDRGRVNQVGLDLGTSGGIVWRKQTKLDIAAAPGSSGSGIFDTRGYLIACLHGTLVYNGQIIRGGQLAIPCDLIAEWLRWRGWAPIVTQPPYAGAPYAKGSS